MAGDMDKLRETGNRLHEAVWAYINDDCFGADCVLRVEAALDEWERVVNLVAHHLAPSGADGEQE